MFVDELKTALRARKVSRTFEKRAPGFEPGPIDPESSALTIRPLCLKVEFQ